MVGTESHRPSGTLGACALMRGQDWLRRRSTDPWAAYLPWSTFLDDQSYRRTAEGYLISPPSGRRCRKMQPARAPGGRGPSRQDTTCAFRTRRKSRGSAGHRSRTAHRFRHVRERSSDQRARGASRMNVTREPTRREPSRAAAVQKRIVIELTMAASGCRAGRMIPMPFSRTGPQPIVSPGTGPTWI